MEPYIWVGIIFAVSGTIAGIVRYSRMGSSKLMKAAEKDDLEAFRKLLRRRKVKINEPGALGDRPLHVAAGKWGEERLVEEVIALGAIVDVRNIHGQTPLHLAVRHNNLEAARVLLENDADVNAEDRHGVTPLQLAVKKRRQRAIALLEQYASS
jgi:ankyrin repeat protein